MRTHHAQNASRRPVSAVCSASRFLDIDGSFAHAADPPPNTPASRDGKQLENMGISSVNSLSWFLPQEWTLAEQLPHPGDGNDPS